MMPMVSVMAIMQLKLKIRHAPAPRHAQFSKIPALHLNHLALNLWEVNYRA